MYNAFQQSTYMLRSASSTMEFLRCEVSTLFVAVAAPLTRSSWPRDAP